MTQPEGAPAVVPLVELQTIAGQNYLTLLNEISGLGMQGFMAVIDAATEEELRSMLAACEVVFKQIQKYKGA